MLRAARVDELDALTELCMRSKAHWGYSDAFMEACRDELTMTAEQLDESHVAVIEICGAPVAVAQLAIDGTVAEVDKLFVCPDAMGAGHGRKLMDWIIATARASGVETLRIEADPDAAGFYESMGAVTVGKAPSQSIKGRSLPLMELAL